MKYIFLDTNIFLHFVDIEEIDWLKEASIDQCTLVITPTVIDELDRKKQGTKRESRRARNSLKKLERLFDSNRMKIRNDVMVQILNEKPNSVIFEEFLLNQNDPDQQIIASIIAFKRKTGVQNIEICSNDTGIRLRAGVFEIGKLILSGKYELQDEESEEQREIKKLKRELSVYQSRTPKLKLLFINGENIKKFKVPSIKLFDDEKIKELKRKGISEIKNKYPYLDYSDSGIYDFSPPDSISSSQIKKYNQFLDEFYGNYDVYLNEFIRYQKSKVLAYELDLILVNNGNVPADDIDIDISFPGEFEIVNSEVFDDLPTPPQPPIKPSTKSRPMPFGIDLNEIRLSNFPTKRFLNSEVSIHKNNEYLVNFWRKGLKHGNEVELEKISIFFNDFESIKNFHAKYEISASNLPEPLIGELHIIFNFKAE